MAKLAQIPAKYIIDGFRGILDFAVYMGCKGKPVPYARAWPRPKTTPPRPGEKANQTLFAGIQAQVSEMGPEVVEAYQALASGTPHTWRDWAVSLALNGQGKMEPEE